MRLLVSVTDADEAMAAVRGGADVIDVKNLGEGALGASAPITIRAVRMAVPDELPVSAALGDIPAQPGTAALAAVGAAAAGATWVTVGLYGVRTPAQAGELLRGVRHALKGLAPDAKLIACAYADADVVGALPAARLPQVAAEAGCAGAMVDTFSAGAGSLFRYMHPADAETFVADCRARGLTTVLAGSLKGDEIALAASLRPDIVGIRSAACAGGAHMGGRVEAEAVAAAITRINRAAVGVVM